MTPGELRQLAAHRPFTVRDELAVWIAKAEKALQDAADKIELLQKEVDSRRD